MLVCSSSSPNTQIGISVRGQFCFINLFPNDRILDMTKLKALADDKLNVA